MAAKISSADILKYITSTKLSDGTWKGSTKAFIQQWEDLHQIYENLVPTCSSFSNEVK